MPAGSSAPCTLPDVIARALQGLAPTATVEVEVHVLLRAAEQLQELALTERALEQVGAFCSYDATLI